MWIVPAESVSSYSDATTVARASAAAQLFNSTRLGSNSATLCDIVHDGDDVEDGGVALKCSSMV